MAQTKNDRDRNLPDTVPWTVKDSTGKAVIYGWKPKEKAQAFSSTDVGEVLTAARKYSRETGLFAQAVRT